jgi:LysM repeat protein
MATKKSAKKTSKKTEAKATKKTAKKTAKKATKSSDLKEESLISSEVDAKLEEQKQEFSTEEPRRDIQTETVSPLSEEEKGNKKLLIGILVVILLVIGYLVLFKGKKSEQTQIEQKIESNQTTQPQQPIQKEESVKQEQPKEAPVEEPKKQEELGYQEYTIQRGDTLTQIMKKFGKTRQQIEQLNPGVDWNKIKPGMVIKIPK